MTNDRITRQWDEWEKLLTPIIIFQARKIKKSSINLDMDDLIQEGRLALLGAMSKYDSNRGDLEHFASVCLGNAFKGLVNSMYAKARVPRAVTCQGEIAQLPCVCDTDAFQDSKTPSPEDYTRDKELDGLVDRYKCELKNALNEREKKIFDCRLNPSQDFIWILKAAGKDATNPTIPDIASYLGLTKNSVDWSWAKIKTLGIKIAKKKSFSDLFGESVNSRGWPVTHMSKQTGKFDLAYVKKIANERDLPLKQPVETQFDSDGQGNTRKLIRYDWGVVLYLKWGKIRKTIVCECQRFNELQGQAFGIHGSVEMLPIKWYPTMARKLQQKRG